MKPGFEIKGKLFGVRFEKRDHNDHHICVRLLIEDDEHWHDTKVSFSSYWIDDIIEVLTKARHALLSELNDPDANGKVWGKVFRHDR